MCQWDFGMRFDSWKDFQYYDLLEQTMRRRIDYRYLLVFDKVIRRCAATTPSRHRISLSPQARALRAVVKLRAHWPHFLSGRIALAGCRGDGKKGKIESDETAAPLVAEALEKYAGSVRVRFVDSRTSREDAFRFLHLNHAGYVRVTGFPPLILDFNFDSFEEYAIKQLSRATRKNLRRKFRAAGNASPAISFEVWTDAEQIIDEIYPLYLAVAETSASSSNFHSRILSEAGRSAPENFAISSGARARVQWPLAFAPFGMERSTIMISGWTIRSHMN